MPARIVMISVGVCGLTMAGLAFVVNEGRTVIVAFSLTLFIIAGAIQQGMRRLAKRTS